MIFRRSGAFYITNNGENGFLVNQISLNPQEVAPLGTRAIIQVDVDILLIDRIMLKFYTNLVDFRFYHGFSSSGIASITSFFFFHYLNIFVDVCKDCIDTNNKRITVSRIALISFVIVL